MCDLLCLLGREAREEERDEEIEEATVRPGRDRKNKSKGI